MAEERHTALASWLAAVDEAALRGYALAPKSRRYRPSEAEDQGTRHWHGDMCPGGLGCRGAGIPESGKQAVRAEALPPLARLSEVLRTLERCCDGQIQSSEEVATKSS